MAKVDKIRYLVRKTLMEYVSYSDLKGVESYADSIFSDVGIDVGFTKHFLDRVNDPRNKKDITPDELKSLYAKAREKYGDTLSKLPPGSERVVNDTTTDINIPVAFGWDGKSPDIDMVAKTVMRKRNFLTGPESPKLRLEEPTENIDVPINIGDEVLGGKFKNKKIIVKDIGKNEKGDITINDKPLLKVRLTKENFEDRIKWDTIILEPAHGDKHNNIQLTTKDEDKYTHMKSLFGQLKEMYPELKFFLQGNSSSESHYWLMFEPWSSDIDKIVEAAMWLSQQLKLPIDIGN